ncbi:MAG: hypothetical protein M1827_002708 [Pycnora praestabilis]|nr:MAG: hypothetical protein M1827_002708 [Pycnora praestabilis]
MTPFLTTALLFNFLTECSSLSSLLKTSSLSTHAAPKTLVKRPFDPDEWRQEAARFSGGLRDARGMPNERPTCYPNPAASPVRSDCLAAYNAMEVDANENRLNVYYGSIGYTPAGLQEIRDLFRPTTHSYVEMPVSWIYRTCLINVHDPENTFDIATKTAVKVAALGIIAQCVSRGLAGRNLAGQAEKLEVTVTIMSDALKESLERADIRTDCIVIGGRRSKKIKCKETRPAESSFGGQILMTEPVLPNTGEVACLGQGDCGWGFTCQQEAFIGTDVSWGLPESNFFDDMGFCAIDPEAYSGFSG